MKRVLLAIAVVVVLCICVVTEAKKAVPTLRPRAETPRTKQAPAKTPMGALVLPATDSQKREFAAWQQLYGYSETSHIYYNLALLIKIINQQGTTINNGREYINMIISQVDPNSLASMVVATSEAVEILTIRNAELQERILQLEKRPEIITETTADPNSSVELIGIDVDGADEPNSIVVEPNEVSGDPNE